VVKICYLSVSNDPDNIVCSVEECLRPSFRVDDVTLVAVVLDGVRDERFEASPLILVAFFDEIVGDAGGNSTTGNCFTSSLVNRMNGSVGVCARTASRNLRYGPSEERLR
jgi:hypothetical protein